MRTVLACIIGVCIGIAPAAAQVLPGRSSGFFDAIQPYLDMVTRSTVASRCGLRDEAWRTHVDSAIFRQIRDASRRVWPGSSSVERTAALQRALAFINDRIEVTLQAMTTEDCATLRAEPGAMNQMDAFARQAEGEAHPSWEDPVQ